MVNEYIFTVTMLTTREGSTYILETKCFLLAKLAAQILCVPALYIPTSQYCTEDTLIQEMQANR